MAILKVANYIFGRHIIKNTILENCQDETLQLILPLTSYIKRTSAYRISIGFAIFFKIFKRHTKKTIFWGTFTVGSKFVHCLRLSSQRLISSRKCKAFRRIKSWKLGKKKITQITTRNASIIINITLSFSRPDGTITELPNCLITRLKIDPRVSQSQYAGLARVS